MTARSKSYIGDDCSRCGEVICECGSGAAEARRHLQEKYREWHVEALRRAIEISKDGGEVHVCSRCGEVNTVCDGCQGPPTPDLPVCDQPDCTREDHLNGWKNTHRGALLLTPDGIPPGWYVTVKDGVPLLGNWESRRIAEFDRDFVPYCDTEGS